MSGVLSALSLLGPMSLGIAMLLLGALSRRLGRVTRARPYYIGFVVSAVLLFAATVIRIIALRLSMDTTLADNALWALVYNGTLTTGLTFGLILTWRYWSWLLAERD